MKFLIVILISISQVFAIDVIPIEKNEKAPEKGFFIDTENIKELRKINEEKKLLKKENVKLQDLQTINEQRINTYKEFAQESEKELYKEKIKGNVKGVWGFILGVLSTSVAAYAAIRVAK